MNETRVIVCGSSDFADKELLFKSLDEILKQYENVEIVSGHAKGADRFAEEYAENRGIKVTVFKAEWSKYRKAAGPIRNRAMLAYATEENPVIVAFWDGSSKGTSDMIEQAKKANADCHIVNY